MSTTNLELSRWGGLFPVTLGQLITDLDLERISTLQIQGLFNFLSLLFYDDANAVPLSGFPENGDHCLVSTTGDLTASIAPGLGLFFDATKLSGVGGDPFQSQSYQPILVDAPHVVTLVAWDATNARIDVVSLAPDFVEDQTATRRVKNPTTLVESSDVLAQRKRFSYAVTVTTGTPSATPVEPATPPGHIKIAVAEVPPTSGAAVWRDCRPLLQLGSHLKGHPAAEYAKDFIPNPVTSPNALKVSASSPTSLKLVVTEGRAVIGGISRWYPHQTVTIGTAHATLPRIDLVSAKRDGTLVVTAGTANASPVPPASPANSIDLAQVFVAALDTTIAAGDITDLRASYLDGTDWVAGVRKPVGNQQIDDYSIDPSKSKIPDIYVSIGAATFPTNPTTAELPLSFFLMDRTTPYAGPFGQFASAFLVEVKTQGVGPLTEPTGTYLAKDVDFVTTEVSAYFTRDYDGIPEQELYNSRVYFKPTTGATEDVNIDGTPSPGYEPHVFWTLESTGTLKIDFASDGSITAGTYNFLVAVTPIGRPGGMRYRTFSITIA